MLTREIAVERVAKGASFLDRRRPTWFRDVDTDRLALSSCTRCVLGQLSGVSRRGDDDETHFVNACMSFGLYREEAAHHGFAILSDDYDKTREVRAEGRKLFALLQDAWIAEIARRLHPVTEETETKQLQEVGE